MKATELKIDDRVWHPIFLWGKVLLTSESLTTVLFDFKEATYYHMGIGYKTYKNDRSAGSMITMPTDQLFKKEIPNSELPEIWALKKLAMNATIVL